MRFFLLFSLFQFLALAAPAPAADPAPRAISADYSKVAGPRSQMWRECIGAGRAGEGLRPDWQAQLKTLQDEIGFRSMRFHGIFHDEMGVYREDPAGNPIYDWTKVDALYDAMLKQRIRPFVEIGFMPKALAGDPGKVVFWWKGIVSMPKDWDRWQALVTEFVGHLTKRYGRDEIAKWNFEIWNEPDNGAFLPLPKGADRKATYFELYDKTARAVKNVDAAYRVGGPSVSWVKDWISDLIADCTTHGTPIDFITFHSYGLDGLQGGLDTAGGKRYFISADPLGQANSICSQGPALIAKSARPDLPIHVTEWNTSYAKHDHVHDSYYNAAIMLGQLRQIEKKSQAVESVSRWTFTDIFEEDGPPPAAFWGGFGLITIDGIKKSAYFAFKYLAMLGDRELMNADKSSWVCRDTKGGVQALLYDLSYPMKEPLKQSDNEFFGQVHPPLSEAPVKLALNSLPPGSWRLAVYRTGYQKNDAYSRYLEMGSPRKLEPGQVAELKALASDRPEREENITIPLDGHFERSLPVRSNDIYLITLTPGFRPDPPAPTGVEHASGSIR